MGWLATIAVFYFLLQAVFFWWLGQSTMQSVLRVSVATTAILLVPTIMYVDGLYREFGDGGAANAVVSLLAAVGGVIIAFAVFVFRSIAKKES